MGEGNGRVTAKRADSDNAPTRRTLAGENVTCGSGPIDTSRGVPLAVAIASFVPLIGVVFGAIAVFWGVGTDRPNGRKLASLGAIGIVSANFLLFLLFFLVVKTNERVLAHLVTAFTQIGVDALVDPIEDYRTRQDRYPRSLMELAQEAQKRRVILTILDPMSVRTESKAHLKRFHYELAGSEHYFLRSVGEDGVPFTADDIVPGVVDTKNGKRIGLLVDR